jgi:NAD(P)-dependent dehydrogenase (short-subunit alcohol dehydrogenase family)
MEIDMASLAGRTALVTGGSRGIGAAIARRLAAEGADVALTYASSSAKAAAVLADIEALGRRALAIQADARDGAALQAAVARTVETLGGLDILVNNAGVFVGGGAGVDTLSLADFDETLAVNTRAVFVATQAAVAHMRPGGRVISIGSNLAERAPMAGMSAYVASKAAVVGLTKAMARDLGPREITVNVVNPGSTDTDMNPSDGPGAAGQLSLMAIPRYGDPANVASLVAWLAGPEARSVTGASFLVDGGANI